MSAVVWSSIKMIQTLCETSVTYMKVKNNMLVVSFQQKPDKPFFKIMQEIMQPLLIQSVDKKIKIVIRELNKIPPAMCIDLRIY
jgi:hypothetical protein